MKKQLLLIVAFFTMFSMAPAYASFPAVQNQNEISVSETSSNNELSSPAAAASGKSQLTAVLLCFFLGGLGIHRFYLGYTWQGVVQLLTLGGLGIWALIDFIRILTGDLQPKNGSYSKTL